MFIGYVIGFITAMIIAVNASPFSHKIFKHIKIDYSIEAKTNYRPNMAGEYAIYTKKHFWNKWVQRNTYADYKVACLEAERMKKIPKYF
jgi:hypothetical protein